MVKIQKWYQVIDDEWETIDNTMDYKEALQIKKHYEKRR